MNRYSIALLFTLALVTLALAVQGCASKVQQPVQEHSFQEAAASKVVLESKYESQPECVILLHGLMRTRKSMIPLGEQLQKHGYQVVNVDYPSRDFAIATLTEKAIPPALDKCRQQEINNIHFVTHSLGGILVRQYLAQHLIPELKRVVMLAPPNQGSEIVDNLKNVPLFAWINGPAGKELGTDQSSLPNTLGGIDFDLGIIAGTTSVNLLLSLYLPNPDDGKVSVENTKIAGMRDFITLPVSHPFIMKDKESIAQIIHFLQQGKFVHAIP